MRDPDELSPGESAQIAAATPAWREQAQEWLRDPAGLDRKVIEDALVQYQILGFLIETAPAGTPRSTVVAMIREAREIGVAMADALSERNAREDGKEDAHPDRKKGRRAGGRAQGKPVVP